MSIRHFSAVNAEHSSCAVGAIVALNGKPNDKILRMGTDALATMHPRIGVASDGAIGDDGTLQATSDGAGIITQIPQTILKESYEKRAGLENFLQRYDGQFPDLGVGVFFLPRDSKTQRDACRSIAAEACREFGYEGAMWRDTPVRSNHLGAIGRGAHPRLVQLMIPPKPGQAKDKFHRELYFIQRTTENRVLEQGLSGEGANHFYIASMSAYTMVYKSLSLAHRLRGVYPDLDNDQFETSFVGFHGRFSTNTAPAWWRAHFKRVLGHNGEINTLKGNINATYKLEKIFGSLFRDQQDTILTNLLNTKGADSDILDNAAQFLYHAGVSLPLLKTILIPPAVRPGASFSPEERQLYQFTKTLSPGWEGPGMFVMTDGKLVLVGGDLNGMRPTPYEIFGSEDDPATPDILVVGSERGMVHNLMVDGANYSDLLSIEHTEAIRNASSVLRNAFYQELEQERVAAQKCLHDLSIKRGDLQPGEMIGANICPDNTIAEQKIPVGFLDNREVKSIAMRQAEEFWGYSSRVQEIESVERRIPVVDQFPDYTGEMSWQ